MIEYMVTKLPVQDAKRSSKKLNELGEEGWEFKFATAKDSNIVAILQREKPEPKPKRPKKKTPKDS